MGLRVIAVILLLIGVGDLLGQKEANIWYFGDRAGLDFNSGTPVPLFDGAMNTLEGCATMSDQDGNLLFYTDGISVWDANHDVTPNGFGLLGDPSATQSGIIVKNPDPLNDSIFYIFTVPAFGNTAGMRYSIFNMNLNGGLGDVTNVKNEFLASTVAEKVTAVRHANGRDIWILTRRLNSNEWQAYLMDVNGVNTTPVVTNLGANIGGFVEALGHLRASPDGTRVAAVHYTNTIPAQIADFDAATGQFSNLITLSLPYDFPFGIEFAPDSNLIYFSGENSNVITQFNLDAPDIQASEVQMTLNDASSLGALQLGPDRKIYVAQYEQSTLSVINDPNQSGLACDLIADAVDLQGRICWRGLPNFFPDIFYVTNEDVCLGDSSCFQSSINGQVDSLIWDFGEPSSGDANMSNLENPCHLYSAPGQYDVMLIYLRDGQYDTIFSTAVIDTPPQVSLYQDTTICFGETLLLGGDLPDGTYEWQDQSSGPTFLVDQSGLYSVTVTKGLCQVTDSIEVSVVPNPETDLGSDTMICDGQSLILDPGTHSTYEWQDMSVEQSYEVTTQGQYSVQVIDTNGCSSMDTIIVSVVSPSDLSIGEDTFLCANESFVLEAAFDSGIVTWSDNTTGSSLEVSASGTYSAILRDLNGCLSFDTVEVTVSDIVGDFVIQDLLCHEDASGSISADFENISDLDFEWSSGQNTPSLQGLASDSFHVLVINRDGCQEEFSLFVDQPSPLSLELEMVDESCYLFEDGSISITSTSGGAGSYTYSIDGTDFFAQNGFSNLEPGSYIVSVMDANDCVIDEEVEIEAAQQILLDAGNDVEIIFGESIALQANVMPTSGVETNWISGTPFLSCISCLDPMASPTVTTDFMLQAVETSTGCLVLDTVRVVVDPADDIYIPNVFSPNGDGVNDVFFPYGNVQVENIDEMKIFNRWGQLVYSASNIPLGSPVAGWNGTHKGEEAPAGVYLYYLKFNLATGQKVERAGDISLLR